MSIDVQHISKTFGNFRALDDVSLKINDGELVALLGPSGSGKTTLLRIIAGLEAPDPNPGTSIRFYDEDVSRRAVGERQVGFVFQHYALFRHMTVFENVAFGLRVRHKSTRPSKEEIRDRVERLLSLVQLAQFSKRYPSQLSGGQRQRVALARALAVEPKVLLLDEPFGALDAQVRKGLRAWLRRLHEEIHITSVLVTHDQEEALEVADRVVVMNNSKIEQEGTPDEVFHNAKTQFVMEFLGQVNVFHGRVQRGKATLGDLTVDYPHYSGEHEQPATVYMRPHEFEIRRASNGKPSFPARITRTHSAGAVARVFLETEDAASVLVELPLDEFAQLALQEGETVHLYPKNARVFVPSESK
ncbi:MAG: sulfate/molybdate ABC transporter ATP-binding protein [Planctomycetaceae bacterium]|nr:sulfate/molybdate ABC transporter ATP-binding protein [Planctomycetaceae bacterium]